MPRARRHALGRLRAAVLAATMLTIAVLTVLVPTAARGAVPPQTAAPVPTPTPTPTPAPALSLTGDGATFELHPGAPAYWQVGVTTRAVRVTRLVASLSATGPLTAATSASQATISLASCTLPWQDDHCPGKTRMLLATTPLGRLAGDERALIEPADAEVPAHVYLLATVLLPSGTNAGASAGADAAANANTATRSAVVSVKVSAAGDPVVAAVDDPLDGPQDDPLAGPAADAYGILPLPVGDALASTGTRIGLSAALAGAAVGIGAFLAAVARRQRARRARPARERP